MSFTWLFFNCAQISEIKADSVDHIELIQLDHPYIGYEVPGTLLDSVLITDFLKDFSEKTEEVSKFYSCYEIKIQLKNGQIIRYRTNGQRLEKIEDNNTAGVYFKLNHDINLVTKYWEIPKEKLCNTKEASATVHAPEKVGNIPQDAFWIGGIDGGQWYLVDSINKSNQTIYFKIYNDYNGDLIVDKPFKLHCNNYEEIQWNNIRSQITAFDGQHIILITVNKEGKYCYFE